jgi:translocation and assembly module TamA
MPKIEATKTWLDSLHWLPNDHIGASLQLRLGTLIRFDSLIVRGKVVLKQRFLQHYLGIEAGKTYNESLVRRSGQKLRNLPYLSLQKEPEVFFKSDKAYLIIYADAESANQLDGFIGILPNQNRIGAGSNTLLTGQATLELQNPFGAGKHFKLQWQRFRPQAQQLAVFYKQPNLLNLSVDVSAQLELLQEDSTFTTLERRLNIIYPFEKWGNFSAFVAQRQATALPPPVLQTPPLHVSSNFLQFGIGYEVRQLDNFYFPRKGFEIGMEVGIGTKRISRDTTLASDDFFSTIALRSNQVQIRLQASYYQPINQQTTLLFRLRSAALENPYLFQTDLIRLGGIQNLRGFNENTFFAQRFLQGVAEYRLYFEAYSYLFAFAELTALRTDTADLPRAAGVGLSFRTKAGIFNFAYALGTSQAQPLGIGQAKVHFGLTTRF